MTDPKPIGPVGRFKRTVAPFVRDIAARDARKMKMDELALFVADLAGANAKLRHRLAVEKDARKEDIDGATVGLQVQLDEAKEELRATKEAWESLLAQHAREVRELQDQNRQLAEAYKAAMARAAEDVGAAGAAIGKMLSRPHRILDIYGVDVYQAVKDVYASIGGDVSKLPAPELARRVAEEAAE